jgi:osmotically-inducible protein OsmY
MRYFLLVSLLSLVGCNASDQADLKKDATKLAESSTRSLANAGLAAKVNTVLNLRKGLDASTFSVESEAGTITLKGTIPTTKAKKLILELVRETKGVERVVDKTIIKP